MMWYLAKGLTWDQYEIQMLRISWVQRGSDRASTHLRIYRSCLKWRKYKDVTSTKEVHIFMSLFVQTSYGKVPVWCKRSVSFSSLLEVVLLLNDALHDQQRQYKHFNHRCVQLENMLWDFSEVGFSRENMFTEVQSCAMCWSKSQKV